MNFARLICDFVAIFFFSSRRRHTRCYRDWSSDVCSSDLWWMVPMGDLARSNPVLQQLRLPPLGRAARGHVLLTKTLLIVGQEGNTQRESSAQREASADPGYLYIRQSTLR